ncbi:TetR/AcrR family transcriptional regulator [Microbacterium sp. NPDC006705]|uniref:TetR/AcrR family transcriptional regulator n=1 Tax=Microbacterium TaxID=33882 RepID=UPI002B46D534|nr:TetR/AcrR family transcriptional regulator [Microbacterium plantarum]WRK17499.1 TetR/AcrR family transcriptional regulator [Microbacterium plantarum]
MPRRRDPERFEERRAVILDAAAAEFAASGYAAATTASIHRRAGVSSGTLFHYFPTKLDLLVGVLEAGRSETERALAEITERAAGMDAVLAYAAHLEAELADELYPGLVRAIGDVERLEPVRESLAAETAAIDDFLTQYLAQALDADPARCTGQARAIRWLFDGAAADALAAPVPTGLLVDAVRALLRGMGVPLPRF